METDPGAAAFIIRWTRAQHRRALTDPDQAHLALVEQGRLAGFVLLAGLSGHDASIEPRRIVVSPTGRGLGAHALSLLIDHVFDRLGARRVWLDVKLDNVRAQRAYERAGFFREGILREALLTDGVRESLIAMSILEP